jgi:hypothetical protein
MVVFAKLLFIYGEENQAKKVKHERTGNAEPEK